MTVKEWLESLANSNTSTDKDSSMMQNFLHRVGFPEAVVVVGIVYLEGHGTLEYPPMPINQIAQLMLKKA